MGSRGTRAIARRAWRFMGAFKEEKFKREEHSLPQSTPQFSASFLPSPRHLVTRNAMCIPSVCYSVYHPLEYHLDVPDQFHPYSMIPF